MFSGRRDKGPGAPTNNSQLPVVAGTNLGRDTNRTINHREAPQVLATADDGPVVYIGAGTTVGGEVRDCDKIDVLGTFEGTVSATVVVVHGGGCVRGAIHARTIEVHGRIEGQVNVDELLDIRSTAIVDGELSYGDLKVEAGGQMSGNIVSRSRRAQNASGSSGWELSPGTHTNGYANGSSSG
jgi:cytoskeletal protein CcmA (bactofilin family)